mmetsp:Transcript_22687/g.38589  ORF Transcript_22687/g.38589 Transcript_22687/m.38589 type:complete len:93 (+) Transcript_22687:139-417(+)
MQNVQYFNMATSAYLLTRFANDTSDLSPAASKETSERNEDHFDGLDAISLLIFFLLLLSLYQSSGCQYCLASSRHTISRSSSMSLLKSNGHV